MVDVHPISFVAPIDEQVLDDILPTVLVRNLGDQAANVTGQVSIYRQSLGIKLYTSVLHPGPIAAGTEAQFSAETIFSPGAIADDDYFIMVTINATNPQSGQHSSHYLGPYYFDIKPGPMGPAPAAHYVTHQDGGIDEMSVSGLSGLLADPQTPANHADAHQEAGSDPVYGVIPIYCVIIWDDRNPMPPGFSVVDILSGLEPHFHTISRSPYP